MSQLPRYSKTNQECINIVYIYNIITLVRDLLGQITWQYAECAYVVGGVCMYFRIIIYS